MFHNVVVVDNNVIGDDCSVITLKQSNITPGRKHITMSINSTDATTGSAQGRVEQSPCRIWPLKNAFLFFCILTVTLLIFTFLLVIADALSLFLSLFVTNRAQRYVMNTLELGIRNGLTLTGSYLYMLYNAQFADNELNHVRARMEARSFQEAFENAMMHVTANRTPSNISVGNRSDESMSVSVSTLTAPSDSMDTSSALP